MADHPVADVIHRVSGGYEPFEADQFSNREQELQHIETRVEQAQSGSIRDPLLEYYGVVGQGKSWLLSRLVYEYWRTVKRNRARKKPTFSAKVDLTEYPTLDQRPALLQALVEQLALQLGDEPGIGTLRDRRVSTPDGDLAQALVAFVIELTERYVPVLAFDATDRAQEALLDWLEEQIVQPLIGTDQAILIVSGRFWYRWKIFEVRRRLFRSELPPLDRGKERTTGTKEMLEHAGIADAGSLAPLLYEYAFGHALATKVIVNELQERYLHLTVGLIKEQQSEIAKLVREQVIDVRFLGELGEHEYLRELLWAVCILRKFNPTPLRDFASTFVPDRYKQESGSFYLNAIRDMQDTTLVQWDSAAQGYTLAPVVRRIMAKNLAMRKPAEYRRRHQRAVQLYDQWIERFPRNAVGFLLERTFHRYWDLSFDPGRPEVKETLIAEFNEKLDLVWKHPDVQWDLPDMAVALEQELERDGELREVLTPEVFARIEECAQNQIATSDLVWA